MDIHLNKMIRCKNCGRLMPKDSSSCRYCGYEIKGNADSDAVDSNVQSTSDKRKKIGWFIALGVLALFTLISVINTAIKSTPKSENVQTSQIQSDYVDNNPKIVNRPYVGNAPNKMRVSIWKVTMDNSYTVVECAVDNTNGAYSYIAIDAETYIVANGNYIRMIDAKDIAISPGKTAVGKGYVTTFTLYFPNIRKDTKVIDLVESGKNGWKFYGIRLD